jgi:hypothetical protein
MPLSRYIVALMALAPAVAWAQEGPEPTFLQGGGVKLGESVVMHPRFDLSTGYNSNVFSQDDTDSLSVGAAVIKLGAGALVETRTPPSGDAETLDESETARPAVAFRGDLYLFWQQFVSGGSVVTGQSDLGAQLMAELKINPLGQVVVTIKDAFQRLVRPGQAAQDVDHDYNDLGLHVLYRPGGGALGFGLGYNLVLDIFESGLVSSSNRVTHKLTAQARWQWLLKTEIHLTGSFWIVDPIDDVRPGSTPLRVMLGVNTLLTPTLGAAVRVGYGNSFYSTGPNFSSYLAVAELRYRPRATLQLTLGYSHDFADAYIGSYYTDHALYAAYQMQIGGRVQLTARADMKLRHYDGILDTPEVDFCGNAACENTRDDLVLRADLGVEYQINSYLFAGLSYALNDVTTDFFIRTDDEADSAGYVVHEIFARLAAKF